MDYEQEQKKDIMEAIKNNRLYDYIASNYWRIENNILIELLKECVATLKEEDNADLIDNLKEWENWEE